MCLHRHKAAHNTSGTHRQMSGSSYCRVLLAFCSIAECVRSHDGGSQPTWRRTLSLSTLTRESSPGKSELFFMRSSSPFTPPDRTIGIRSSYLPWQWGQALIWFYSVVMPSSFDKLLRLRECCWQRIAREFVLQYFLFYCLCIEKYLDYICRFYMFVT